MKLIRAIPAKPGKYKNVKTEWAGETFDSKAELHRYLQLKAMERGGMIRDLTRQVSFELIPKMSLAGKKLRAICYVADFVYFKEGRRVVEDKKGFRTREYILKKRLMKHIHDIEVLET